MDNITGLMVALMFVTLLTIAFGNILGAIAPRLATPRARPKIAQTQSLARHPLGNYRIGRRRQTME